MFAKYEIDFIYINNLIFSKMKKLILSFALILACGVATVSAQTENKEKPKSKKECCSKEKKAECKDEKKAENCDKKAECTKDKKECAKK